MPPITANVEGITANGKTISADAVVLERRYVYPKPQKWYQKVGQDILVGGRIAYHFFF